MCRLIQLLFVSLFCFAPVQAFEASQPEAKPSEAPEVPPSPCDSEGFHQFDFWLGDWEVTNTAGTLQGNNKVSSQEGGCLILEEWTSASGGTGQSYNFYDPVTELWRQVWVSKGIIIDYTGGLTDRGSMKLTGEITYHASATTAPFTGEWTPNADGSVTQHFEQYDSDKDTWNVWFTGIYRKPEAVPDAG